MPEQGAHGFAGFELVSQLLVTAGVDTRLTSGQRKA
jgi:hypothetical protein